ncbi:MAG: RHS repeat protein, partial [Clostridia bacterium]|nr:RHS repeat protein [Clostridia bacterium]
TGKSEKSCLGYDLDISSLQSGEHTVYVRGVDLAGNEGEPETVKLYKDVDAPVIKNIKAEPDFWTDKNAIVYSWEGLKDEHVGMQCTGYILNDEEETNLNTIGEEYNFTLDVSALEDGEHSLVISFKDKLDNELRKRFTIYRDTHNPEVNILAPSNGDIVNGTLEIWGGIKDISLDEWVLTAKGSSGKTVEVKRDGEEQENALLGILNTSVFEDGETVEIILDAKDKAGHFSTVKGIVIKVDKSAKPIAGTVNITTPFKGQEITTPTHKGEFVNQYEGVQKTAYYYVDSELVSEINENRFDFDAIIYPESTLHSITAISEDTDGVLHYSSGLSAHMILSDSFADDGFTENRTGVNYSSDGASLAAGINNGEILFKPVASYKNILALRLKTKQDTPFGTSINYLYTLDGGKTWHKIIPDEDIRLEAITKSIQLKAEFNGNGADIPKLFSLELEGIIETSPVRVTSKLLRKANVVSPASNPLKYAITRMAKGELPNEHLFLDNTNTNTAFTFDAKTVAEDSKHSFLAVGENENTLHTTNGNTSVILRQNINKQGNIQSGRIDLGSNVYAIRLDVLASGNGKYYYSLDGANWKTIKINENVVFGKNTQHIYLKAEMQNGAVLRSWHLEGLFAKPKTYTADLVVAPVNLVIGDWGDYFENEKLYRYTLSWKDKNLNDTTADNDTIFEIYRNGELIGTTNETEYMDKNYFENAEYSVRAIRTYKSGEYKKRISGFITGNSIKIAPEIRIEGVMHDVYSFKQSEFLNDLYGGNYTFSDSLAAPTDDRALNQRLLGKSRYCAAGFEPVNFNTGNFYLETQDFLLKDTGIDFDVTRTYNTLSEMNNGPFGSKWEFAYSAHLVLYKNGDVGYRKPNGALVSFFKQDDGSYIGNDEDGLKLSINDTQTEYHIIDKNGKISAFSAGGLLAYIEDKNGSRLNIERNEDGFLTAIITPSGTKSLFEMDEKGHIVKIITPLGNELKYEYDGNNLVGFTDANGNTVKYTYDNQGRMTEWFDGNGTRQVLNRYDNEGRVVWQKDANGGEYTLEYFEDHTITTDANGGKCEIWFDEQKRTIKQIDAMGNTTEYSYDDNGNMHSSTDETGQISYYEYDANGNKIKDTAPDGSIVAMEYDESNNLTKVTDQLGKETKYEYDDNRNLIKQTSADKSVVSYGYDKFGNVIKVKDSAGNIQTMEYDGVRLIKSKDALGNEMQYSYDLEGRMTSSVDALGNKINYEYDGKGNMTKLVFSDGTFVLYTYDANGNKTSMTDPKGNVTKYEYDGIGNVIKTIFPDGTEQISKYDGNLNLLSVITANKLKVSYTYDANGNKTSETDALGNVTRFEYDTHNRPVKEILPTGAVRIYEYDAFTGLVTKATDETGLVREIIYDRAGNILEQRLSDGSTITNEYDAMNRLTKQTDAEGGVTTYTYDAVGNITSRTNALGGKESYTYDGNGNVLTVTDAAGGQTKYEYDALSRIESETNVLGGKTTYEYDVTGNLVKQTDPLGNSESYTYDESGNLIKLTDAGNNTMQFNYDKMGNQVLTVQKNGGKTISEYDSWGNLTKQTDPLGNATTYEYNAAGLATRITDPLNQSALVEYDSFGNIKQMSLPNGNKILYNYDNAGRAVSMTNENGVTTEYTYDKAGNLASTTTNGNETRYSYDKLGNIISTTDAEGRFLRFEYDAAGNCTKVIYPDNVNEAFVYDRAGRLIKSTGRDGLITEYTYDKAGNVILKKDGRRRETKYEYDVLGRLLKTVYPDGTENTLSYDALGNISSQTDAMGNTTGFEYTPDGLIKAINLANGTKKSLSYNLNGNVTAETDALGNKKTYEYDAGGRMIKAVNELGNASLYEYDSADNIVKQTDANGNATAYSYDGVGNLTSETDPLGNKVEYGYTPEGWLKQTTKADGKKITFEYDKTGNLLFKNEGGDAQTENSYNETGKLTVTKTAEGITKYQYDEKDNLIMVLQPNGEKIVYDYDKYGRRKKLTYPDGKSVSYSYDNMDRLTAVK